MIITFWISTIHYHNVLSAPVFDTKLFGPLFASDLGFECVQSAWNYQYCHILKSIPNAIDRSNARECCASSLLNLWNRSATLLWQSDTLLVRDSDLGHRAGQCDHSGCILVSSEWDPWQCVALWQWLIPGHNMLLQIFHRTSHLIW